MTGHRLSALALPYTTVIHSSMMRAQETARQIHEYVLPSTDMMQCDLLREGAPFPPEPPTRHWRPETQVVICPTVNPVPSVVVAINDFINNLFSTRALLKRK